MLLLGGFRTFFILVSTIFCQNIAGYYILSVIRASTQCGLSELQTVLGSRIPLFYFVVEIRESVLKFVFMS